MENALADVRIVFAEELTSLRIQRDEAGRVWRRNVGMRPVLTIRSTNINNAVHDENRAVGSIVWKYAELIHHVVAPDNIAVFRSGLDGRRGTFRGFAAVCEYVFNEIFAFLFEGAFVSIGHAIDIQAQDFATAAHNINPVSLHGG